jgi:hypothetical protein
MTSSSVVSVNNDAPSRFLNLPLKLRLMIYEYLTQVTRHQTFEYTTEDEVLGTTKLVTKSLPVALLATCKFINTEATPIFALKLRMIAAEPMRIIVDSFSIHAFFVMEAFSTLQLLTTCLELHQTRCHPSTSRI